MYGQVLSLAADPRLIEAALCFGMIGILLLIESME